MGLTADYDLGEYTYPRGWFMVADARELEDGPIGVRYFGKDFALYRGESGRVVMLDAYCPHMGTHLARNRTSFVVSDGRHVEGDSIRCPYHAWRFGPDGVCNQIPYANRIPQAAAVKSYHVIERAGAIFAWHDPEEQSPDIELPAFAEWDDPAWVRWEFDHLGELRTHQLEILYNLADLAHLGPVHASPVAYFEDEIRGPICSQRQGGYSQLLVEGGALLETDSWYMGPGVMQSTMTGHMDSHMIIAHTPVEDGLIKVWHGLMVKAPSGAPTEEDVAIGRAYQAASCNAFRQDFEIWANKRPAGRILQIPEDGPFHKVRLWASQFYNPRAKAAAILAQCEGVHGARNVPRRREDIAA